MTTLRVPLTQTDPDYFAQVRYAMSFASEEIASFDITTDSVLELLLKPGAREPEVLAKVSKLLERYADRRFGLKEVTHFKQERELTAFDAYSQLIERKWVTPIGQGHAVLRGPAARLQRCVDAKVVAEVAGHFSAEEEIFPATILCKTLDRVAHFTSFPEHVDFVAHLREDVEVLSGFATDCRDKGWGPEHHAGRMSSSDFAISPSCCYHCYEGMEGWRLQKPGRSITALLDCHRYEAGNLTTMSRLRAFHMREVIWVGHPEFVRSSRLAADQILLQWARDWEIDCTFENANDMFFTDDYAVKASFQRQQEAKRELRLRVPQEERTISCASSNFHAATFGKAFDIQVDGRPATSACMGWGHERWVYAIFSQFGLDLATWPPKLRADLERYAPLGGGSAS
jgi:hypothetical protein